MIERALVRWRPWLRPGGCVAFSDFVWWTDDPSGEAREFWSSEYSGMASEVEIRAIAEAAGYRVTSRFRMSEEEHDAYYVPLQARVAQLAGCADAALLKVLESIRKEIDVVRCFADEAGVYVLCSTACRELSASKRDHCATSHSWRNRVRMAVIPRPGGRLSHPYCRKSIDLIVAVDFTLPLFQLTRSIVVSRKQVLQPLDGRPPFGCT